MAMQGTQSLSSARSARLLDALREHEAQAAALRAAYGAAMAVDSDGMLYWIAEAAKQLRLGAGRKLVHVAASGDMDQSTIYRFERHHGQPESIDATIAAYADDLDREPIDVWELALEMWRDALGAAGAIPLSPGPSPGSPEQEVDRLTEETENELESGAGDDQPDARRPRNAAADRASPRRGKDAPRSR